MISFNSKKQLMAFLAEDIGKGDITSVLLPRKKLLPELSQGKKL